MGGRAGIWLRVSTGGQDEANQEPDVRGYCEQRGYEIVREYRLRDRSAFHGEQEADQQRALDDVRDGVIDVLVCWHSDRLERRGIKETLTFLDDIADAGARIESVQESTYGTPDGILMTAFQAHANYQESKHKSQRVGIAFDRIRGNSAVIGRAPFGYVIEGEKYEKRFAPTDDGRKYVPAIFERVIAGDSTRMIGDWLRSENVQTRQGSNVWSSYGIVHIIRNRAYMGLRVEERTGNLVGRCEPLVDTSTWEAANKALTDHAKPKGHARKNSALLTGIIKCSKCGGPMYRMPYGRKTDPCHGQVYRCSADPKFGSARRSECANLVRVELADLVMRGLLTLAQAPVMERRRIHAPNQPSDRRETLKAEIDALDKDAPDYLTRMVALATELQGLAGATDVPDTWEWAPTGEMWADVYARMTDDAELRAALLAKGVELRVDSKTFPRTFGIAGLGDVIPEEVLSAPLDF